VDFFGTDAYLHLVSGEKLWFLAPPEHKAAFMRLFKRDNRGATIRLSKKQKKLMEQHNMSFIHQRAGDAVFVPAGWPHMVKNLSDTVSFGNSYLRPWNMPRFLAFVKHPKQGLEKCSRLLNVRGIIEAWMSEQRQREWGVTPDQAEDVMRKWGKWIKKNVMPSEEPTSVHWNAAAAAAAALLLLAHDSCLLHVCLSQARRRVCAGRSSAEPQRSGGRLRFIARLAWSVVASRGRGRGRG
jgi:hypothetical protein